MIYFTDETEPHWLWRSAEEESKWQPFNIYSIKCVSLPHHAYCFCVGTHPLDIQATGTEPLSYLWNPAEEEGGSERSDGTTLTIPWTSMKISNEGYICDLRFDNGTTWSLTII